MEKRTGKTARIVVVQVVAIVVPRSLLGIRKDPVSLSELFKLLFLLLLFLFGGTRMPIGMMDKGSFLVGLFDFIVASVSVDSEDFVIVFSQRLFQLNLGVVQKALVLWKDRNTK